MQFKEQFIFGIKTPILLPENLKAVSVKDGKVEYADTQTGNMQVDEPIFYYKKNKIFLNQFRSFFPNESVIILLFSPNRKLFLHRRSIRKKWAPGKIDLASIAGQRRALLLKDHFKNEEIEETALREISEETGVNRVRLSIKNIHKIGIHYNPHTKEYQTIFAYTINVSLIELNENIKKSSFDEVEEWFEQDYNQTMKEYFGDKIEKYAGGMEMRPVNFISDPKIKKNLDKFFKILKS